MSTNISKEKRDDLIEKIKQIRGFISAAPQDENTGNLLTYLSEIEKDIKGKKYGLVFEEHREGIDETLATHTPVLTEDKDLFIDKGGQMNFLIEGDNLASLQLLEKTHAGKIDLIYIDPPYNTGNKDFIYDDNFVDTEDGFRHSKWLSFMKKRLEIAHRLLSDKGVIFISIDDNEQAQLKVLCDSIFGEINFLGNIIQNKLNAKNDTTDIQKNHEFIVVYRKKVRYVKGTQVEPTITSITKKVRPVFEDNGEYYYINDSITTRGEGGTLSARPNLGYTVYFNPASKDIKALQDYDMELAKDPNSDSTIYHHNEQLVNSGYHPIIPPQVRGCLGAWTWSLEKFNESKKEIVITGKKGNFAVKKRTFVKSENVSIIGDEMFFTSETEGNTKSIIEYSTNDGTNILNSIMGKSATFNNPKNLSMIQYLIGLKKSKETQILDFFAGSGTTGHAVMKLNAEDGGNRKFILCTNNENNICRDITYERIKRVIDKEGYSASLKYYKVDYVPISEKLYYEYADELLHHIRELVELENGVNFEGNQELAILLTEDEVAEFIADLERLNACKKVYLGHDVLLEGEQEEILEAQQIEINIIPEYYYKELDA